MLVRRSQAAIGPLERGILERIKANVILCQLPHPSQQVIAYRVAGPGGCPSQCRNFVQVVVCHGPHPGVEGFLRRPAAPFGNSATMS